MQTLTALAPVVLSLLCLWLPGAKCFNGKEGALVLKAFFLALCSTQAPSFDRSSKEILHLDSVLTQKVSSLHGQEGKTASLFLRRRLYSLRNARRAGYIRTDYSNRYPRLGYPSAYVFPE